MTVSKAKILGRFYFFLVTFIMFIPVSYGVAYIHVLDQVAESYITYNSEGDPVKHYKLETVSEEEWALLKQEHKNLLNIVAGTTFICSGFYGASFGEDVIINDQEASFTWDERSRKMFVYSLLISSFIWHPVFIIKMYGSSPVIVPKILGGAVISALMAFAGAGNLAVFVGEPIIHKLLAFHKS